MHIKRLYLVIFALFVVAMTYLIFATVIDTNRSTDVLEIEPIEHNQIPRQNLTNNEIENKSLIKRDINSDNAVYSSIQTPEVSLPINILYRGVDEDKEQGLFDYKGNVQIFSIGDPLFNQPIILEKLTEYYALVRFQGVAFNLELYGVNLLARKQQYNSAEYRNMSPAEIGTRPKILEHIVKLVPAINTTKGMIAMPGANPKLFDQAGLKPKDIIFTINGLSVKDAGELIEIQAMIPTALTLEILVERNGQTLVLYLDIPTESLEISN